MCSLWNLKTTWEQKISQFLPHSHTQCTLAEEINCNVARKSAVGEKRTFHCSGCKTKCFSPPQQPFVSVQVYCTACLPAFPNNISLPAAVRCTMSASLVISREFYMGVFQTKASAPAQISLLGVRCQLQFYPIDRFRTFGHISLIQFPHFPLLLLIEFLHARLEIPLRCLSIVLWLTGSTKQQRGGTEVQRGI